MEPLPIEFITRIQNTFGSEGDTWLQQLPTILQDCAGGWSLTLLPPFEPLSYNYVAPARRSDGSLVVLKVGVPNSELWSELAALELMAGRGAVRLLDSRRAWGALLLEQLIPGTPLSSLKDDEEATRVAAGVMADLWQPVPAEHPFPSVARWALGLVRLRERFNGGSGPFPESLVATAETLYADLLPSMEAPMVLHGDLHHENIVAARRQPWLALDPKGLVGEPAYEVGALLRNPIPGLMQAPDPGLILDRRVRILSETLGFDRQRLIAWGLAQAVLSAWWDIEDSTQGWEHPIGCAQHLARML